MGATMTRLFPLADRRAVVRISRRFAPGHSKIDAFRLEVRSLAAPFVYGHHLGDEHDQPQMNILQSMTVLPLAISVPTSASVQQLKANSGPVGVTAAPTSTERSIGVNERSTTPTGVSPETSTGFVEPFYTSTGSSGDVVTYTLAALDGGQAPVINYAPPIGGGWGQTSNLSNNGNTAQSSDLGQFEDATNSANQGIILSDISEGLNVTEGSQTGKVTSVTEVVGSSNNGYLTPVVDNFILANSATGAQIPSNSVVSYGGGFTIGYRNGGQTSPVPTEFSLQFMFQGDGISASVGSSGLTVNYSTGSGNVKFNDPNFPGDEASYTFGFSGTKTGNTTTAQFDSENGVLIDGWHNLSNFDNFTWKYEVGYGAP
jgi:hypothetical protein